MTRPNFYQKSFGVATHLWHFRWGQTRNRKTLRVLVLCKIDISSYLSFVGWPSLRIWKDEGARSRRKFWRNFWWDFRSGLDTINSSRLEKFIKWTHKSEMVVNGDGMFLHIMTNSHWLFQYFKKTNLSTCRCLLRRNLRRTQPSDSALAWMRRLDLPTHFHQKVI